jgi:ABC-type uncharacterized transport system permease subunit
MGPFDAALLAAAITLTTPILLAAMGEVVAERSGMINIGLEGMMLTGALSSFIVADATGSALVGCFAGGAAGLLLALIVAVLAIEARADQIVVGIGINLLAAGITGFGYEELYASGQQVIVDRLDRIAIPLLSSLPVVGDALFDQNLLVYLAYLLVPAVALMLRSTNWGLAVRASGERPEAVDTAGVSVRGVRWATTALAGFCSGLGGAFLVVGQTGLFQNDMSAGRGFLAFAAVVFGRWSPKGVLAACFLFGAADALQLRLQASDRVPSELWVALVIVTLGVALALLLRAGKAPPVKPLAATLALAAGGIVLALTSPAISLPSQLWLAVPYLCALVALAGLMGHARMPRALGLPYLRGD